MLPLRSYALLTFPRFVIDLEHGACPQRPHCDCELVALCVDVVVMLAVDSAVGDDAAASAISKRRRLMPTCFGGKTVTDTARPPTTGAVRRRAGVLRGPAAAAAAGGGSGGGAPDESTEWCGRAAGLSQTATVNWHDQQQQCRGAAARRQQVHETTSVTAVSSDWSAMSSHEQCGRRGTLTDSGYETTTWHEQQSPTPSSHIAALSRGQSVSQLIIHVGFTGTSPLAPLTHYVHHPLPLHSSTPGSKLSCSANPSHHSLPFLLPD